MKRQNSFIFYVLYTEKWNHITLKFIVTFMRKLTFEKKIKIIITFKNQNGKHHAYWKMFLGMTLENTTIKTYLSFTFLHKNFGPPIKLFRHYAFSSLGSSDTPSRNPVWAPMAWAKDDVQPCMILHMEGCVFSSEASLHCDVTTYDFVL
jgi:hypothetical protein